MKIMIQAYTFEVVSMGTSRMLLYYLCEWMVLRHGGPERVDESRSGYQNGANSVLLNHGEAQRTWCFTMEPLGSREHRAMAGGIKCKPGDWASALTLGRMTLSWNILIFAIPWHTGIRLFARFFILLTTISVYMQMW